MSDIKPCEWCGVDLGGYFPSYKKWPYNRRLWLCDECRKRGKR